MCLKDKRFFLLLLSYLVCFAVRSQTLYWVGGNGNFTDPLHWSYSPGGLPANVVPGTNSSLIFANTPPGAELKVHFASKVEVTSISIQTEEKIRFVQGLSPARIVIGSKFDNPLTNKNFNSEVILEFRNNSQTEGYISTGDFKLGADVIISLGKWKVNQLNLNASHGLYISKADVHFAHAVVAAGNLDLDACGFLDFDHCILNVDNETKIKNSSQYSFKRAFLNRHMLDDSKPNDGLNSIADRGGSNQINSLCVPTPTVIRATCSPGCDGEVIISLPAASCYTPAATLPYQILIDNSSCPGSNPISVSGVGPGTYTLTNFCGCATPYILYIQDANGDLESTPASVPLPAIYTNLASGGTTNLVCNGVCSGAVNLIYNNTAGSAPPYSFTITPPTGPQSFSTTSGNLSLTGLCAGTLTVVAQDSIFCTHTFVRNFVQPPAMNTNSVLSNVLCNAICTGSLKVSPTGGTPNYTITFSTGPVVAVSAGGSASITALCAGTYSAVMKDSKSCTITTSGTIIQPPALTVTASQTSVNCYGACTGSASILVTGGTSPYSFTVTSSSGPITTSTTPTALNLTSLCVGGYTVTIRDNNGCMVPDQIFSITQPPVFNVVPTSTNVTCSAGPCNGAIALTPSGGNGGPYTYSWSPGGATTSSITGQCAGSYTVSVKDASSCATTSILALTQPPAFTVSAVTQTIACFGFCNGGATVTASGGNGPTFNYTWSPAPPLGQGTATISNLCGGTSYTATITDASLCATTLTLSIAPSPSITPNITSGSVTCNSACNGSISAAPSGTATFNYTLTSSLSSTVGPPPYMNLCAGTYTLYIKDLSSNCTQSFTVGILQPNPLVGSISTTSVTCFNKCDGSLSGIAAGGTPTYTMTWATPSGTASGGVLNGQCAGSYTLSIKDANGCITNTAIATINQPTSILVSITSASITCFASCNGALTASVSGGTPGYSFNWSNGSIVNPDINLCVGTYTVLVTDANTCTQTAVSTVTAPTAITLTQSVTEISCAGGSNGSATITASGGTGAYTFQFNTFPVTTNTTGVVSGLAQGAYSVNVTDANGCPKSIVFNITQPSALSAAITGSVNSCNACTGAATVSAAGGTPPYISYAWTNTVNASVGSAAVANNLCPGDYTVTVTDNNLCTASASVHIALTVNISIVAGGAGIQCYGACTGSAVANPSGGVPPYNYTWTPTNQIGSTATGLCAGVYNVLVVDNQGCSATKTTAVTQPSSLTVVSSQTNATCFGTCNGAISTTVSGGTSPITYTWSNGSNSSSLTGVCSGTYALQVRDQNLCSLPVQNFTITQNAPITAVITSTNPSACVAADGKICAVASGGSGGPYSYSWSPVAGNTSCLAGLNAGSFSVTVVDLATSCSTVFSSVLTNPAGPTLTAVSQSVACFGGSSGGATVTASGVSPFTFTWNPVVTSVFTSTSSTASGLSNGIYVISATDNLNCIASKTVSITQASSVTVNATVSNITCNGANNGSITLSPSGGTPGYSYSWLPSGLTGAGTATVTGLSAGNYTVTVTDAGPCSSTFTFNISQPAALTLTSTSSNVDCNAACDGSITAGASGGTGVISYNWPAVAPFNGSTTATVLNLCPNIYTVIATDVVGCSISTTVQIIEPSALTSTLVLQNASCSNSCDAIAVQLVAGGTPGYAYSWSTGSNTTSTLFNLCAGNYTGTVVDANGCAVAHGFTVTPPPQFTISLVGVNPLCNAICSGSITTTVNGAQGSVTYAWAPAGSGQNPTSLCAGNYNLTATDSKNCEALASVSLVDPPAILANVTTVDASCASNCNGTATSNPINATSPISYSWTSGAANGPNAPTWSNICSGNYTLQIQDNNGCQALDTFTLTDPPPLVVNPSTNPSTCGSANGMITANVVGGTPNYSYNWLAPAVSSTDVASGLAAGIYTLIVSDANNCTNTVTIPLSNSNGPSFAPIISTSVNCFGQCTGAASVDIAGITGGTPSYSVSWLPPAPSPSNGLTNLCAGGYTAEVTDVNSCVLFTGVNILEPPPILLSPSFGLPTCNGICDGSLSLNPSGGVGPSFTYTWLPAGPSGPVITNACAGTYTIEIEDNGNSCVYPEVVTLPAQLNITVLTTVVQNNCFGDCNGSATASNAQGGVPPYSFSWSNGQSGATATNLCNGTYSLIVTDANGCSNTFPVVVGSASQLSASAAINSPSCGLCNGSSTISASGGTAPYTYSWSSGANSATASNLCAGLYQVLIADGLGCQQTETVIVNNSNGITGDSFVTQPIPCSGACNGGATVTAVGGNGPISYSWVNPVTAGPAISNLCAGTYFVQMTDSTGCLRTSSVTIDPITTLTLSSFITPPGCGLSNGVIDVVIAGGTPSYSVVWSPAVGNTATVSGISQGSYTITVTESGPNACPQSQQINVSNANGPAVSVVQSNVNCFNACTGSITAMASGPASPFTYNWNTGNTSPSLNNLCKGAVTLTVTDANNCVTINTYTITDNPQLQAGIPSIAQPSCNLCNGTASLNIFGGTLPYTYTWTNGSNGPGVSGLCAGLYQVKVVDNLGCQQTETITVNNSNGITGENFNVQGLPCNGTCNGSATVTALGGNQPVTYNWLNPATTNSVITNLCAGTYFVQMTDAQGCIRTSSVDVNALTVLSVTASIVEPGCQLSNGSISVLIAGGTPSYNVSWTPTASATPTLTGISQGSYTVTVIESGPNNCSLSQAFNVSNANGPTVSAGQTNINCFNDCTGALSAIVSGTAAPFSYNWSVGGNAPAVTNLCKGVVTLSVTDANNCVSIQSYTIADNPQLLPGVPLILQPTCNQCNGSANISALGGVLPYTYSWTTGAGGSSVTNLCAGLYQVQITDNLGCQQTQDVIINNANGISGGTFSIDDEICSGTCNGSATVAAVGGASPISYNWVNPAVNNPVITNLCAGIYFVQMTDANGCIFTASTTVNSVPGFSFTPVVNLPDCGMSNGSIEVTLLSGGISPYSCTWLPAGTGTLLSNVGAGTYTLTITDQTSCSKSQIFTISNSTAPAITFTQSNINCFNACTGSITALASGSVAPFSYNWSVGTNTAPTITNLCKGLVTLTVTSSDGCVAIRSFTLTDNPELDLSLPFLQLPSCKANCDGAITLIPNGGSLPYTFNWVPSGGSSNPQTALCAGNYSVTITDAKGCVNSTTVTLNAPIPVHVTANFNNSSCSSAADGSIGIVAIGGSGVYTYSWTGPGTFTSNAQNIANLFSGTYSLSLSDNKGCTGDTTLKLVTTVTITASAGRDTSVCSLAPVTLNGSGSIGATVFDWYQLPNMAVPIATTPTLVLSNAASSGTFVLLTVASVSSCIARDTVVVNVFPDIYVDAGPSVTIPVFSTVIIGGNPTIETSVTLTWTPSTNLSDPTVQNPVASNTVNTTYTVMVTDVNGCMASDTMQVLLYPEVKFPTGFTPNGDGKNDTWIIDYIDQFPNNTVEVFNRWGEQLFYSKGYATPFNGTYNGKDLPVGTYYYIIHLNHPAYTKPYTGPLTIFR